LIFIKAFNGLKTKIVKIRSDSFLLYLCFKDKRTPRSAKIISLTALALAFSPIDLIPDFIPVLGYLDDIIIIPLLIFIAFKLIPEAVISDNRSLAETFNINERPVFRITGIIIVVFWIACIVFIIFKSPSIIHN